MIHKITLMEAYVIEALQKSTLSADHIVQLVAERNVEELATTGEGLDFSVLYHIESALKDILRDGYEVKFLTFPGLKRLLQLKLNKEEGTDYEVNDFTIEGLSLSSAEVESVEIFLSQNWELTKGHTTYTIRPRS